MRSLSRRGCCGGSCGAVGWGSYRGFDDDGAGSRGGDTFAVGDDVGDGVGGRLDGADVDGGQCRAVDVCGDALKAVLERSATCDTYSRRDAYEFLSSGRWSRNRRVGTFPCEHVSAI